MEGCDKVFTSRITRAEKTIENDLYELLNVIPAVPITIKKKEEEIICDLKSHSGKQYQPKKRSKFKVKTVRDIRRVFEENELSYLPAEIQTQQEYLLGKIKAGSSRDKKTKTIAKKLIACDKPLSRSSLQMLMTINPHDHSHNVQYALYHGKRIRINGSTGGNRPDLFHFDLSKKIIPPRKKRQLKQTKVIEKKGLLRNSLAVKFKPGPLTKKINLDDSYQKYNVGTTELVKIPKPGLSLQPSLGVILEPSISKIVQNFRDENGTISEKWAEFSVSVLSTPINSSVVQNDEGSCVTFELKYKFDQKKFLMRQDIDRICGEAETVNEKTVMPCYINSIFSETENFNTSESNYKNEDVSEIEIKTMIYQIIDSVEINLLQDEIYTKEAEPVVNNVKDSIKTNTNTHTKEKKKKRFCELDKLDVTVIRLPDDEFQEKNELCQNSFCALGCVCPSLLNPCSIKQHCGRVDCMFQCKCDFSKYCKDTLEDTGLLPGIINLDNEINLKLSKEEQKFHRTVVVSGGKSIVLKSEKRNCKASKRYADFYTGMSLKTDEKLQQEVSVVLTKLDCKTLEPWCMVHKLYKCFCKGKFTECSGLPKDSDVPTKAENCPEVTASEANVEDSFNRKLSTCSSINSQTIYIDDSSDVIDLESEAYQSHNRCARAMTYSRKHNKSYYSLMNSKIKDMEKNDENLRKRLQQLVNAQSSENKNCISTLNKRKGHELVNKLPSNREVISTQVKKSRPRHERASRGFGYTSIDLTKAKSKEQMEKLPISHFTSEQMPKVFDYITQRDLLVANSVDGVVKQPKKPTDHDKYIKQLSTKPVEDKAKLTLWLESNYQQYKKREQEGKVILEAPKNKKIVIYSWSFILSRYNEKKNVFLVTKNMPYRLFMAVDTKNSFFKKCIRVDSIRMSDLEKYPVTVQKLITSAPDLDDSFYILCGLHYCWEFVGSVCKIDPSNCSSTSFSDTGNICESINNSDVSMNVANNEIYDSKIYNKWFVVTVEEDLAEIRFSNRGFFVKYLSIIKAAEVARLSGKTVRLSSQKNSKQNIDPQFGIYAVPHSEEYCVFIGPYQKEDNLGIEVIASKKYFSKVSKGFWLTTKLTENIQVLDDPLSFLRLMTDSVQYLTLTNEPLTDPIQHFAGETNEPLRSSISLTSSEHPTENPKETNTTNNPEEHKTLTVTSDSASSVKEKQVACKKTVKPIKIRNTNGTFRLIPKGYFTNPLSSTTPRLIQSAVADNHKIKLPTCSTSLLKSSKVVLLPSTTIKKPTAEIAPQIKIVDVYSESSTEVCNRIPNQNTGRGMLILKPEEINKRIMKDVSIKSPTSDNNDTAHNSDRLLDEDIEDFLASSTIYVPPNADILMNSVEEQIVPEDEVFIECTTVENLGWIKGKRNADNNLSFKFPGFAYTQFYPELEAFSKINQGIFDETTFVIVPDKFSEPCVTELRETTKETTKGDRGRVLSRKVYVPTNIILEWQVVESEDQIKYKDMLSTEQLGLDFVLTKRGLRHKRDIMTYARTTSSISTQLTSSSTTSSPTAAVIEPDGAVEKASDILNEQEDKSEEMDERNDELLQAFVATTSNSEIFGSMSDGITNYRRDEIAERLRDLLATSTNDDIRTEYTIDNTDI